MVASKKAIWGERMGGKKRFLIAGTGNIIEKMKATWDAYHDAGVEICAADIRDDPVGRKALPAGTPFYNWKDGEQLARLVHDAWDHPFDFAYLSTFPAVHIASAIRLDFIARSFIFPKPIDSHFNFMETIFREHTQDRAFRDIVSRSFVHDHYRNKPLTLFLRGHIADLHRRNGFLKNIRLYVTEHRSIQSEFRRRESLECGMILDLGPHALSVVYEIVPERLTWQDGEGNTYARTGRRFEIVSAVRARDNLSILRTLGSETFAAVHFRVFEDIEFTPRGETEVADRIRDRPFDILIVVGKGVSISDASEPRDLKAIEMEFDGQSVLGNFDTNAVSGMIDRSLQRELEAKVDQRHRGLNLPLLELGRCGFSTAELARGHLIPPFQPFSEAFSIACLLEQCRAHHTAEKLLPYATGMTITDLVNRCVAKGLDRRWAMEGDLTRLVFGEVPENAIP
jgi:hypothetical protein